MQGTVTLYEVDMMYRRAMADAEAYAAEHEGVIPDDLGAKLDGLGLSRDGKIANTARYLKEMRATAKAIGAEVDTLRSRQATLENRAEWLENYLRVCVPAGEKHADPTYALSWRRSTAVEVSVPAEALPEAYRRVKTTVDADKVALKAALEVGTVVAGAELVTRHNIQIK